MKVIQRYVILLLVILIGGCSSTPLLLRPAPKDGINVTGMNILFVTIPPDTVTTYGTRTPTVTVKPGANFNTKPRLQTDRLSKEIGERLPPQLMKKGIVSNFASIDVLPGVAPTPLIDLFPADSMGMHTLVITPVYETEFCGPTCQTTFTVSLSLRTPKENNELWNLRLEQSITAGANWIPSRNNQLIDDIANSVLAVTVRK